MGGNESEEHTYLPEAGTDFAELRHLLGADGATDGPLRLCLARDEKQQVELPETLRRLLVQAVEVLDDDEAVTIVPWPTMLTTQQAADILEVSRTTVIRLISDGELPAERPGTRRKLRLADVLDYRERRRQRQHEMLAETFEGLACAEDGENTITIADGTSPADGIATVIGLPSRKK